MLKERIGTLDAARSLLAHAKLKSTRVAYACGYDSIATFYRVFRNATAMTPNDWRAMHRKI
ncbi:helix-turn-helix domain-containing protein [Tardiphaga sp. 866_E4_N2_1]|uniref:helix-turn-helix domain-containing protein n=1 Tax=unclassified Tardiphaga TaxID=2631404 RepID=UPI003F275AF0